jgi:hypothetical protein
MPWVGFESTIQAFELAKTVHALGRVTIVIGPWGTVLYQYSTWETEIMKNQDEDSISPSETRTSNYFVIIIVFFQSYIQN